MFLSSFFTREMQAQAQRNNFHLVYFGRVLIAILKTNKARGRGNENTAKPSFDAIMKKKNTINSFNVSYWFNENHGPCLVILAPKGDQIQSCRILTVLYYSTPLVLTTPLENGISLLHHPRRERNMKTSILFLLRITPNNSNSKETWLLQSTWGITRQFSDRWIISNRYSIENLSSSNIIKEIRIW